MKLAAQCIFTVLFVHAFFASLRDAVNGRKAREPEGFRGAVTTIIATAIAAALLVSAGAFSELGRLLP